MSQTLDRLIQLVTERFGLDPSQIQPDSDIFETLSIDSYQALELLTELEMAFNVELPDYELQSVRTFASLAEKIDQRL